MPEEIDKESAARAINESWLRTIRLSDCHVTTDGKIVSNELTTLQLKFDKLLKIAAGMSMFINTNGNPEAKNCLQVFHQFCEQEMKK